MKYIGKYGEYRVLARLLELDIEAYPAIKTTQPEYDLTAIIHGKTVVRIQVKSTQMCSKSTNNTIKNIGGNYNILVVVIVGKGENASKNPSFFVMTKDEASRLASKGQISTTQKKKDEVQVRPEISDHRDKWEKIKTFQSNS